MSLINQVLNDLDKRGVAKQATGDETVRVVPFQPGIKLWQYVLVGAIFAGVAAAIWLNLRRTVVSQKPAVTAITAPASGVLAISHTPVELQPQPQPQPHSPSQPAPAAELSLHIAPAISRAKPAVGIPKPNPSVNLTPANESQNYPGVKLEPPARADKQLKKITPQQQAESEFSKAYVLAQKGRLQEAAIGYQLALRLDPTHVMAREALVSVLQESKRYPEAENVLKDALALDEKQTHFAMLLARLQVERNAVPTAIETLEKSLPYADRMADYQAFMAALLQRQGKHKEAITFYQNALQLSPVSGLWLMGLGISMQADQQKEEALDAYKRAIDTHNLSPDLQAFVEQRIKEIKPKEK